MEFTEFASLLKPIIGGAENTHSFVKTLFDVVVTEDGRPFLEDVKESTYKAYFNGKTKITKMAQRINPYLEPDGFAEYLEEFSDTTAQQITDTFSPFIDELYPANMSEKLANFFCNIIRIAAATEKKKGTPKSAKNADEKTPHDILEEKIIVSGQAVANAWGEAISNLVSSNAEAFEIPEKCPSEKYPYSSEDKALLQEFTSDYDEIMLELIGENYGASLIDMNLPQKVQDLYSSKWSSKSDAFLDPILKSYVYGLLGELNKLSNSFFNDSLATPFMRDTRTKIRNLYVKLHPDLFAGAFPYDAFIDDWDEGEF
ncbi:MAG: hypothetical protein ACLVFY_14655 [Bacteroides fragilis]